MLIKYLDRKDDELEKKFEEAINRTKQIVQQF